MLIILIQRRYFEKVQILVLNINYEIHILKEKKLYKSWKVNIIFLKSKTVKIISESNAIQKETANTDIKNNHLLFH